MNAAASAAPAPAAASSRWTSPLWIGRAVAALGAALLLLYPVLSDDAYYQNMVILSLVFAVGASGLNVITGFAGYVSLGQGAFFLITVVLVSMNFVADLLYSALDPRVSHGRRG